MSAKFRHPSNLEKDISDDIGGVDLEELGLENIDLDDYEDFGDINLDDYNIEALELVSEEDDGGDKVKNSRVFLYLYLSHFLSIWSDRMWEFCAPLALSYVFETSILPAALFAFSAQLVCILGGSFIGNWVDKAQRLVVVRTSLIMQNVGVAVSAALLVVLLRNRSGTEHIWSLNILVLYAPLVLANAVASLFSIASNVAVTKDWVVLLCSGSPALLSEMNAMMTRINLSCKVVAPLALSLLMQYFGAETVVLVVSAWNVVSLFPEFGLLTLIYRQCEMQNSEREKFKYQATEASSNFISALLSGWRLYSQQVVTLASLSYVLLYVTVLAPGPLINSWLKISGVSIVVVGIWQGAAAVMGISSTFITPSLINRFGLVKIGITSQWTQLLLISAGCIPLILKWDYWYSIYIFLGSIALSRASLWTYDLVEVQIMQLGVMEHERGTVNAVEQSLTNLATLLIFGLGAIFASPEQFSYLILISLGFVFLACLSYLLWVRMSSKGFEELAQQNQHAFETLVESDDVLDTGGSTAVVLSGASEADRAESEMGDDVAEVVT